MATSSNPERQALVSDEERNVYKEFLEKVKRTVYLEHLSPQVTEMVIKTALGQVGQVQSVEFIPNQVLPFPNMPQAALVEMDSEKKAEAVISTLSDFPFMISGMPRPVRAIPAEPKFFPCRPKLPGKRPIQFLWVKPLDEGYDNLKRLELMSRKQHQEERLALIKVQMDEEAQLAKQGQDTLTANYKKYEIIEKAMHDGTIPKLANHYNINLADDI